MPLASRPRVLHVEDSVENQILVRQLLEPLYEIEAVGSVEGCLARAKNQCFELFLVDIVLPDGDGFEMVSRLKSMSIHEGVPVIFVTSKKELRDRLTGFALGADDYIIKPFEPLELLARVQARLRSAMSPETSKNRLRFGRLELDLKSQRALYHGGGRPEPLELSTTEFRLLSYFISNPGQVLLRQQILEEVWGGKVHVTSRNVDTQVYSLRKKTGLTERELQTVPGFGYMLCDKEKEP
jgi:DNA-binding response OmpR family regulator